MDETKKAKAAAEEAKATAQGELETASKTLLLEKTAGAAEREYSFVQLSATTRVGVRAKQAKDDVLNLIQGLAKNGDKAMSLLAQRVEAASMLGADPFAKIKGLISEMIEKLEEEAAKEAAHKAFCDKEMSETKAKKEDKES